MYPSREKYEGIAIIGSLSDIAPSTISSESATPARSCMETVPQITSANPNLIKTTSSHH